LPKGEDFQCQIGTTTEEDADGRQECGYDAEHDSTFVATRHSKLQSGNLKALILMLYELLARYPACDFENSEFALAAVAVQSPTPLALVRREKHSVPLMAHFGKYAG
jgi:hypothetical protein